MLPYPLTLQCRKNRGQGLCSSHSSMGASVGILKACHFRDTLGPWILADTFG
jgi:hypothetical protein